MKKLSENLFAPAFDRSRTGELRKEDGVNQMSLDKFIEYLKGIYESNGPTSFIVRDHDWITVHISRDGDYFLDIRYDDDMPELVQIAGRAYIEENAPDLLDILRQDYVIADHLSSAFRFTIKSKIVNEDIIKIIDTMIACTKKDMNILHRR